MMLSANLKKINQLTLLTGVFFMMLSSLAAKTFEPVYNPTMNIIRTSGSIDIDGNLDDPGWQRASNSDNFVERHPGDNIEPLVETKVMITYNQDYLYVGFICHDDPATIRATMCQRDQFYNDDAVAVMIDTYRDATWAYEFFVNPYGVQKDFLWTNITGEDSGYDLIWKSAAKITPDGYQVEMAIPFNSIRFPNHDVQNWKMDFWRIHPRESYHQYSWTANDRNEQCWPCKWGTISGIRDVQPGKGIEILPSWIANQRGNITDAYDPKTPFENEDVKGEMSLGGKYSINSDITFEATYNPDFSQIEADAGQIDVNSPVALFLEERRPFFQEGRDIFRTLFNSLDTRTIHDPEFAAKLTGRSGKYRFGFISAVDENSFYTIPLEETMVWPFGIGKSYVNVFRAMRSFGENSQLGFIVNDRRFEAGGYNTVLALDQQIRLSPTYRIVGQYLMTLTEEPDDSDLFNSNYVMNDADYNIGFDGESFTGFGFITQFRRNARNWNLLVDYNQVGRNYRTETGYDPWIDYRNFTVWNGYNIYFEKGLLERLTPQMSVDNRWNFDGDRKWTHFNMAISGNMRYAQTGFSASFMYGDESWSGVHFNDLWNLQLTASSALSDKFGYYFSIARGVNPAL
ncbi:MAG: carbohydrate binding family 9 domain-containing protein, partial [Candidatus Zixiibacteriota bacterium]